MRLDKFTLKAQEVVQNSQQTAENYGHQQIEPEHILRALLDQKEGPVHSILNKIGVNPDHIASETEKSIERLPKVSGSGYGQAYISPRSKNILDQAFKEGMIKNILI